MSDIVPVAVVIPHYDDIVGLRRALESVSRQTCRPVQVIVVDDSSPEPTRSGLEEVVGQYRDDFEALQLVFLPQNMGPATARNEGWRKVEVDYIAFLDADDAWHPQKLEIQYGVMIGCPDTVLSSHEFRNSGLSGPISTVPAPLTLGLFPWLVSNRASTPTVMLKADLPLRFPEGERSSEDYQLWLSIVASGNKTKHIPLLLGRCFKPFYGHSGLSRQLHRMELGQLRSIRKGLSVKCSTSLLIPLASAWSIVRYIRRLVLVAWRRWRGMP